MNYYTRALSLWNELLSDKSQTTDDLKIKSYKANTLGNIGIVYRRQGNYPNALDYYLQALKMDEETGVKKEIATDLGNIGIVYYKLKDYPKTLRFYYRALTLDKEIGNLNGVARHLGNIGSVYAETKDYAKALENFMQALILAERLDNKGGIARHLSNIGSVYHMMSDYSKALEYYSRALVIKKQLGSKTLMASGTRSIGTLYTATNNFALAEQLLLQSFQFATEAGSPDELKETYKSLSELYKKTGQHAKALYNYERSVAIADSLYNSEKDKEITRKELTYEFDKKESLLKAEHEKEKVIAELNKKKQNIILLFVSIGLLLVFIFSAFVFKALKVTRRQKQLIEEKSRQTEEQKKIIEHQRDIVEQKNKDIIDSINYAKRIQEALLKEEEYVTEHLPEHFILFKPKDIVSGDFYWALEKEEHFYIAAVDCTGHGVPGAFMSMLGVAFLNEITSASRILSPAEILEELRHKIVKELGQSGKDHESKDGMDMSLVRLNLKTNELQWAGANNPLYIISDGKLQELKPDKQCIGFEHDMQPFKNHNLTLAKASSFYLFTDGYADQFGGNKGKKFKNNQLKDLLIDLNDKSLEVQKNILDQTFIDWKGNLEQVDDVCIVGVKV
ncbi:MAG: protein serine/threonine phosphatase [Bacteroidota bacterium]|nr:protein serine/threonine phosphatase [Bacteroidota bacterium]